MQCPVKFINLRFVNAFSDFCKSNLSNSLYGLSRGASKIKKMSVEGFNSNGKVYHCNCDCERAAIQNRENRIQNTKKTGDS